MTKNYMADVAKMLGVELGEEFKIGGSSGIYKFFENGLCFKYNGAWLPAKYQFLDLIKGELEIVKLPWQPKVGEKYYYPGGHFESVHSSTWGNYPSEIAVRQVGFVFRTYEECEASLATLREKYLGGNDNA